MADTIRALDAVYRHIRDDAMAEQRAIIARQAQEIQALKATILDLRHGCGVDMGGVFLGMVCQRPEASYREGRVDLTESRESLRDFLWSVHSDLAWLFEETGSVLECPITGVPATEPMSEDEFRAQMDKYNELRLSYRGVDKKVRLDALRVFLLPHRLARAHTVLRKLYFSFPRLPIG